MTWYDQDTDAQFANLVGGTMNMFAGMIPDEESLNRMIDVHLETIEKKTPRRARRSDGFHASSVGDMCTRYETMKRAIPIEQDQKQWSAEMLKRFQIGHFVHDGFQQRLLGKMRVLRGRWRCSRCTSVQEGFMSSEPCPVCEWQVDREEHRPTTPLWDPDSLQDQPPPVPTVACAIGCKWPGGFGAERRDCALCERGGKWNFRETHIKIEEHDIVGSYDGVVLYNAVERILEMKTKDVWAFEKCTEPHARHVIQTQVYMWGSGIHEAVIVYINKNSGELKEFLVEFDKSVINGIIQNIGVVHQALVDEELPNGRCGGPRDKRAKSCPFKGLCFKGTDSIKELQKLPMAK